VLIRDDAPKRTVKAPAPIFTSTYDLASWVLQVMNDHPDHLSGDLCNRALGLLSLIAFALKGRDRLMRLDEADEILIRIRLGLRLAADLGLIEQRQALYGLEMADGIGRQLGAWLRAEEASCTIPIPAAPDADPTGPPYSSLPGSGASPAGCISISGITSDPSPTPGWRRCSSQPARTRAREA
jgi:hypothetical protein